MEQVGGEKVKNCETDMQDMIDIWKVDICLLPFFFFLGSSYETLMTKPNLLLYYLFS